jgi:hypothetical protein
MNKPKLVIRKYRNDVGPSEREWVWCLQMPYYPPIVLAPVKGTKAETAAIIGAAYMRQLEA